MLSRASFLGGSLTLIVRGCFYMMLSDALSYQFLYIGIVRIWHYKRLTRKLRKKARLPELYDEDDLPDPMYDPNYVHVLNQREQDDLHYREYL